MFANYRRCVGSECLRFGEQIWVSAAEGHELFGLCQYCRNPGVPRPPPISRATRRRQWRYGSGRRFFQLLNVMERKELRGAEVVARLWKLRKLVPKDKRWWIFP
jgi:hypothetical protein